MIEFARDGEEPEQQRASDGREALLFAVGMLINRRLLQAHDRLTVKTANASED